MHDTCDFFTKSGKTHDYSLRSGVLVSGVILPESSPPRFYERQTLWNEAERKEKRKDSRVAREIQIALPHELTDKHRLELVRDFVKKHVVDAYGVGADYAIHSPSKKGDNRNYHAHILLTTRKITALGFDNKIMQALNNKAQSGEAICKLRKAWEISCNKALRMACSASRVDCRTLKAQGFQRLPEAKQGAYATRLERSGRPSHAGAERRAVKQFNKAVACMSENQRAHHVKQVFHTIRKYRACNRKILPYLLNKIRVLVKLANRYDILSAKPHFCQALKQNTVPSPESLIAHHQAPDIQLE